MITFTAGTDTYGRVKNVAGTPIVTKFAMLEFLPLYPLKSYYLAKIGPAETAGFPFLGGVHATVIDGVPLARLDRTSVIVAYVRGISAALTLVGCTVLVPAIMQATGERLDGLALLLTRGLLISLALGLVVGVATYLLPFTPRREREIRSCCAELLGLSIDPALLPPEFARQVVDYARQGDPAHRDPRIETIRQLIAMRAALSQQLSIADLEASTDRILKELRGGKSSAPTAAKRAAMLNAWRKHEQSPALGEPLSKTRLWALAAGGIHTRANDEPFHQLMFACGPDESRSVLANAWGVHDAKELTSVLQWLWNEGHGGKCIKLCESLAAGGMADDAAGLHTFVRSNLKKLRASRLAGWDLGRLINVARWGYTAGYLDEEQAWQWILRAAAKLQRCFRSWEALGQDFLLGYEFWSRSTLGKHEAAMIEEYEWIVSSPDSPWQQISWNTLLSV